MVTLDKKWNLSVHSWVQGTEPHGPIQGSLLPPLGSMSPKSKTDKPKLLMAPYLKPP